MNKKWRNRINDLITELDNSGYRYITLDAANISIENELERDSILLEMRESRNYSSSSSNDGSALTKQDAEDIIHEYIGKAGTGVLLGALLFNK